LLEHLTIWIILFQSHFRANNNLVILSILDLLLLNNFLKNENEVGFFEIFFLDFQLIFWLTFLFNSKFVVQKNFKKWRSKYNHLKLQVSVQKNFFFLTLNANIFQFVWSKFKKFLPHDLKHVKYKILWLDSNIYIFCFLFFVFCFLFFVFVFVFLNECNRNGNFE